MLGCGDGALSLWGLFVLARGRRWRGFGVLGEIEIGVEDGAW